MLLFPFINCNAIHAKRYPEKKVKFEITELNTINLALLLIC